MKSIPICTADILAQVKAKAKTKNLKPPDKLQFQVYLEVDDDLYKQISDDAKLATLIFNDTGKVYKKTKQQIISLTQKADLETGKKLKHSDRQKIRKQWRDDVAACFDDAEKQMLDICIKHIKAWQKVRGDRRKYVIKSTAKVTVGTLGVVTSTVGTIVAVPAGGFGAVVGIIALAKAISNLAQECYKLLIGIDRAEKNLVKHLDILMNEYRKAGKGKVVRKELVAAAINQIFTTKKVSISVAESEYASFHGKLTGIDIKSSELSKKLNLLIDKQEALNKELDNKLFKKLVSLGYHLKDKAKLKKNLKKLEKATKKQWDKTSELVQKVESAKVRDKWWKSALKELKAKKPGWVAKAEAGMKLIDLSFAAGATDFSAAEQILVLVASVGVEIDDVLAEEL